MSFDGRSFAVTAMGSYLHDVSALSERTLASKCAICLESLRVDRWTAMTDCNHYFHVTCLSEWFRRGSSCPSCRRSYGQCCVRALSVTRRLLLALARRELRLSLFARLKNYIRIKWWSFHEMSQARVSHFVLPVNLVRLTQPCFLCAGVMLHDEFTVATYCDHYFHAKCLRDWFNHRSFECPKCRYVFKLCCVDSLRELCRSLS